MFWAGLVLGYGVKLPLQINQDADREARYLGACQHANRIRKEQTYTPLSAVASLSALEHGLLLNSKDYWGGHISILLLQTTSLGSQS